MVCCAVNICAVQLKENHAPGTPGFLPDEVLPHMKLWHFKEQAQRELLSPSGPRANGRVKDQEKVVAQTKTSVDTSYDVYGLAVVFLESASGLSFSTMDASNFDYKMPSRLVKFREAVPGSAGWEDVRKAIAEAYPNTRLIDNFLSVCRACVSKDPRTRLSASGIVSRLSKL